MFYLKEKLYGWILVTSYICLKKKNMLNLNEKKSSHKFYRMLRFAVSEQKIQFGLPYLASFFSFNLGENCPFYNKEAFLECNAF